VSSTVLSVLKSSYKQKMQLFNVKNYMETAAGLPIHL